MGQSLGPVLLTLVVQLTPNWCPISFLNLKHPEVERLQKCLKFCVLLCLLQQPLWS